MLLLKVRQDDPKDKLISKIKNAKFADSQEIHLLLISLGFNYRNQGSHYTYTKSPYVIGIVKRSGKPVKRVYLENLRDLLKKMKL